MSTAELRTTSLPIDKEEVVFSWQEFGRAYECPVLLCPEEEGGFSVHALTLPGAVSEGESAEEALANIAEAIQLLIEGCTESGIAIPWRAVEVDDIPRGAKKRWILVDA
jgi:predicted RNase H-like HicB family nuclease